LLTPRQAEVVKLAQRGLTAKEIARQLGISKRTVEAHLSEARRRVGVASTVALVGSVIAGEPATDGESSYSCSENAGISEQAITGDGVPSPPRLDRQRRGRPTVMTGDMIAKARLLLSSHSISDIARHLKVSRTTVYAHLGQIRGTGELRERRLLAATGTRPLTSGCFHGAVLQRRGSGNGEGWSQTRQSPIPDASFTQTLFPRHLAHVRLLTGR